MNKIMKLRPMVGVMVFALAIIAAPLVQVDSAHAAGGTATWTGAAGDNKFSTAGNWVEAAIPEDGDMLVLGEPTDGYTGVAGTDPLNATVDNDVAVTFSGVESVATTVGAFYSFDNDLLLAADATITLPSSNNVTFYFTDAATNGVVGAGDLTISGSAFEIYGPSAVSGTLTLKDGATAYPNVVGVTQLILDGGAVKTTEQGTYTWPIHVMSPSTVYAVQQGGVEDLASTITYSGAMQLDADLTVYASNLKVVHFTGAATGAGNIALAANQAGTLTVDAYVVPEDDDNTVDAPNTGVMATATANPIALAAAGAVAAAATIIAIKRRA